MNTGEAMRAVPRHAFTLSTGRDDASKEPGMY
jgi:hypothetical protein